MPPCQVCGRSASKQWVKGVFCAYHERVLSPTEECYKDKLVALKWYQDNIHNLTHPAAIIYVGKVYTAMIGGKYPESLNHETKS